MRQVCLTFIEASNRLRFELRSRVQVLALKKEATTRPFTVTFNAQLAPAGYELMEHFCQENNQFAYIAYAKRYETTIHGRDQIRLRLVDRLD